MSHVTEIKIVIDDIPALKEACRELGCTFVEGAQEYAWYGTSVGDTPLPDGFTADMLGKCQHKIQVPGAGYEIGVVRNPKGRGFVLLFDYWGPGYPILEKLGGEQLPKLKQAYGVARAMAVAKRRGLSVRKVISSTGAVTLQMTGVRL